MKKPLHSSLQTLITVLSSKINLLLIAAMLLFCNSLFAGTPKPKFLKNTFSPVTLNKPGFTSSTPPATSITNNPTLITGINLDGYNAAFATTVNYKVAFDNPVSGLSDTNFTISTTGDVQDPYIESVTDNGDNTYNIVVNTGTGNGSISLNLDNTTGTTPLIGGTLPYVGDTFTIDKLQPDVTTITVISSNINPYIAYEGDVVTVNFTANKSLSSANVFFGAGGYLVMATNTGGNNFTASYTTQSYDAPGPFDVHIDLYDNTDNTNTYYATPVITFNPAVINSITAASANPTVASDVDYTVTFSEYITGLSADNFVVVTTGHHSGAVINNVTDNYDNTYTVNVSTGGTGGILTLKLANVTGMSNGVSNVLPFAGDVYQLGSGSGIATLDNLAIDQGTLTPAFATNTLNYTAEVTDDINYIQITPTLTDTTATIVINNDTTACTCSFGNVSLNPGDNVIPIVVTSPDGTVTKAYSLTVHRDISADLYSLDISHGDLNPKYPYPGTTYFETSVDNTVTSVTLTPTTYSNLATIKVNGETVASNTPSSSLPLNVGGNTFIIEVTSPDVTVLDTVKVFRLAAPPVFAGGGSTAPPVTKTYFVGATIPALSSTITGVDAPGGYSPWPKTLDVPEVDSPSGIATDAADNVYVANGSNGTTYKIPAGGGSAIAVDSLSAIPYGITVDRGGNNLYIADLGYSAVIKIPLNGVDPEVDYPFYFPTGVAVDKTDNIYVTDAFTRSLWKIPAGDTSRVLIDTGFYVPTGVAVDKAGNVYVSDQFDPDNKITKIPFNDPSHPVKVGTNIQNATDVKVDEDGNLFVTEGFVGFNIKKILAGSDSTIIIGNKFLLPIASAVDGSGNVYVSDSGNGVVKEIQHAGGYTISPKLPDGLVLNDTTGVISGKPTVASIAAAYTLMAYNSGGSVSQTVNITVVDSVKLTSLALNSGNLNPLFNADKTTYTATVPNAITGITLTPVSNTPSAVIKINNTVVASGTASGNLSLNEGPNVITTEVTAADNSSTKTYILTVTRGLPGSQLAKIKTIVLSPASTLTLVPGPVSTDPSNPAPVTYATSVVAGTASVSVKTFVLEPHATIKVEGTTVADGATSGQITLSAGTTAIHIVVTAQDGITTKSFTVNVSKAGSSNANLTSIQLSPTAILTPISTGTANVNYATSVNAGTTQVNITPVAEESGATITVAGNAVISGQASPQIALNATGTTLIRTEVTAGDGISKRTYDITVSKNGSSNVKILSLQLNPASVLTPTATGPADVNYTTSVPAATSTVTLTPILADVTATVKVNGTVVNSGTASAPITLNATGTTMIAVEVTGQDGITKRTNSITISKTGSSNVKLATLTITPLSTLTQIPGANAGSFQTSVTAGTTSITVIPTAEDATSVIRVEGTIVNSGAASTPITLTGSATTVHVQVTGQDGITVRNYSILVYKNGSSYVKLQSIRINPASTLTVAATGTADVNYTTSVVAGTTSVKITPVAFDVTGTIRIEGTITASGTESGSIALNNTGTTTVNLTVTGQDGQTVKTYAIVISKNGSSDVDLKTIALNPQSNLSATTGTATVNYQTSVATGTTTVTVTPTANNPNATITVEGATVASGTASNPITLVSNPTTINLTVTGQDNQTVRTYSIVINKNGSSNAKLRAIALTPASPITINGHVYSATVANSQGTIKLTPYTTDATATVKVAGATVISGTASNDQPLIVGVNNFEIVVTAQDGTTTNTYTVQITRDAAAPSFRSIFTGTGIAKKSNDQTTLTEPKVHQAVSPNGDGQNDVLSIDGIENYTDNHLSIMNTGGQLIYDIKGYGTAGNVFDGHSNKTGNLQKPGTYYYSLEYKDGNDKKRKTGYIVLKY